MWNILGPAAGGGLGVLGSWISGNQSEETARDNRNWMERMANTAYQRMRKDLEAAGINPILAASLGGAATPNPQMPNYPNLGAAFTEGASGAASVMSSSNQRKLMSQQTKQAGAQTGLIEANAREANARADYYENVAKMPMHEQFLHRGGVPRSLPFFGIGEDHPMKQLEGFLNDLDARFKRFGAERGAATGLDKIGPVLQRLMMEPNATVKDFEKKMDEFFEDLDDYLKHKMTPKVGDK